MGKLGGTAMATHPAHQETSQVTVWVGGLLYPVCSSLTVPLLDLLKKVYQHTLKVLMGLPVLKAPDFTRPFRVYNTDSWVNIKIDQSNNTLTQASFPNSIFR